MQAAGSSLLQRLTNLLAADALRLAGLPEVGAVSVLPVATGLALTLTLLALRSILPRPDARYRGRIHKGNETRAQATSSGGVP